MAARCIAVLSLSAFLGACGGDGLAPEKLATPKPETPKPETPAPEIPKPNPDSSETPSPTERLSFVLFDDIPLKSQLLFTFSDGQKASYFAHDPATVPSAVQFKLNNNGTFELQGDWQGELTIAIEAKQFEQSQRLSATFTKASDPLFSQQWHLKNTGQHTFAGSPASQGFDLNLGTRHYQGFLGQGVKVAVVDSGLEITHPDLQENVLAGRSWSYLYGHGDPSAGSLHGTAVAGIIGARGFNNLGTRGIAPSVSLIGFDWTQTQKTSQWLETHGGSRTSDALVINESFGYSPSAPENFDSLWIASQEAQLKKVTRDNNGRRGVLVVKSAGNSFGVVRFPAPVKAVWGELIYAVKRDGGALSAQVAATDPDNVSFYRLVVSALSSRQEPSSSANYPLASYSNIGASVWVSAFGGEHGSQTGLPAILTTDLSGCDKGLANTQNGFFGFDQNYRVDDLNQNCNYSARFNGTSAAAPMVSGVAALLFAANDKLSFRDVRHILAKTAKPIDANKPAIFTQEGYEATPAWVTNSAGFRFHNWYGFGLVDADSALTLATDKSYRPLGELLETDFIPSTESVPQTLATSPNASVSQSFVLEQDWIVEAVQVKISIQHPRDGDIALELISPSGTRSVLLQPQSLIVEDLLRLEQTVNFDHSVFLSNAFYGEKSQGQWTLNVIDTNSKDFVFSYCTQSAGCTQGGWNPTPIVYKANNQAATVQRASLRLYGHKEAL